MISSTSDYIYIVYHKWLVFHITFVIPAIKNSRIILFLCQFRHIADRQGAYSVYTLLCTVEGY